MYANESTVYYSSLADILGISFGQRFGLCYPQLVAIKKPVSDPTKMTEPIPSTCLNFASIDVG